MKRAKERGCEIGVYAVTTVGEVSSATFDNGVSKVGTPVSGEGGGSSSLKAQREILPLDGLKARLGSAVQVDYARGYVGDTTGSYNIIHFS